LRNVLEALERSVDDPELEPQQRDMLRGILKRLEGGNRVVHVVGTPGVGKSYTVGRVVENLLTAGEASCICFYVAPEPLLDDVERVLRDKLSGSSDVLRLKDLGDYECEIPVSEFLKNFGEDPKLSSLPKCTPEFYEEVYRRADGDPMELRRWGYFERLREYVEGPCTWERCGDCDVVRDHNFMVGARKVKRGVVLLTYRKLGDLPRFVESHERAMREKGEEPHMSVDRLREVLSGSLVVLDDAHHGLVRSLLVEVKEGVVRDSLSESLGGRLVHLSTVWAALDRNPSEDTRRKLRDVVFGDYAEKVREVIESRLEEWIESVKGKGRVRVVRALLELDHAVRTGEEVGIGGWIALATGGGVVFAPEVDSVEKALKLMLGEYYGLPGAYVVIANRPVLERPSVRVSVEASGEWRAYLLPLYLRKEKDVRLILEILTRLDLRRHRIAFLDRAETLVDRIIEGLRRLRRDGRLGVEFRRLESCNDLKDVATARRGALGVGTVGVGLVGCEAMGISGFLIARQYLSSYAPDLSAALLLARRCEVRGRAERLMDRYGFSEEDATVAALRLTAFEDVLYEMITVAGRTAQAVPEAFLAVLGAGSIVKTASEHPEEVEEVYRGVKDAFGGWAPRVMVYDPRTDREYDLIEDGGELPEPTYLRELDEGALDNLVRWLDGKLSEVSSHGTVAEVPPEYRPFVTRWRYWAERIAEVARDLLGGRTRVYASVEGDRLRVVIVSGNAPEKPLERAEIVAEIERELGLEESWAHPIEMHVVDPEEYEALWRGVLREAVEVRA